MAQEYSIMPYLKLTIIIFLFVVAIGFQYFTYNHQHIVSHWKTLKCSPLYSPLSGFVKGKSGFDAVEDGANNIFKCLWVRVKLFFQELMEPFHYLLQVLYGVIMGVLQRSNSQRKQLSVVKDYIKRIIEMVMGRLNNISGSFIFVFLKVRDAIKRGLASFQVMAYMLTTSSKLVESMMNGVVGDMAEFSQIIGWLLSWFLVGPFAMLLFPALWQCTPLCFSPETLIATKDRGLKKISELEPSEFLADGSQVLAIQRCKKPIQMPLYQLGNTIVSSSHLVYDKNNHRWIPVDHHPDAKSIETEITELYCITTSHHQIQINEYLYSDWEEFETPEQTIFEKTLIYQDLGCQNFSEWKDALEEKYPPGFRICPSILIPKSTPTDPLSDDFQGLVHGYSPHPIHWYSSKNDNTLQVSGTTLVLEGNTWKPVSLSWQFEYVSSDNHFYYHAMTRTGIIEIGKYQFRDYLETNNTNTHCEIRNRCLRKMNTKLKFDIT